MSLCGTLDLLHRPCPKGKDLIAIVDCGSTVARYPDYLVWSFVRNPFSRMYSAYSMAKKGQRSPGSTDDVTFAMFAANPGVMGRKSDVSSSHWVPQAQYVFAPSCGCPAVDFLGRLEYLDTDMRSLLKVIGSPEMLDYYNKHGAKEATDTNFGEKLIKKQKKTLVTIYDEESAANTARYFATDFRLFGYDTKDVAAAMKKG